MHTNGSESKYQNANVVVEAEPQTDEMLWEYLIHQVQSQGGDFLLMYGNTLIYYL